MDFNEEKKNSKNRVKVAIRVRPLINKQLLNSQNSCVTYQSDNQIIIGNQKSYKFDRVFRQTQSQQQVYNKCAKQLILGCFEGYNAAILAYGQTGSGKTFTMGTSGNNLANGVQTGIIPRIIQQLFNQISKRKQKKEQSHFIIKVSFLQIYNEQIIDLLSQDSSKQKSKQQSISIRQQKDGSVSIYGVVQQKVYSSQQMILLLQKGSQHRTTAQTNMNSASSRSHAIFTVFFQQHFISNSQNSNISQQNDSQYITAKFFFVDLAGSQRIKKTGATGATLKQGININLGLLELGNVISCLTTLQKKENQFITYRNSKLTRILQDCLGGNSNTYMIACVSPAESNYEESVNTLKYAAKAMNIKNKPIINRDPHSALISQLKNKIFQLESSNQKLRSLLDEKGITIQEQKVQKRDFIQDQIKRMKLMYINLQKKCEQLSQQVMKQKKRNNQLEISEFKMNIQKDQLKIKLQKIIKTDEKYHNFFTQQQSTFGQSVVQKYLSEIKILKNNQAQKIQQLMNLQQQIQKLHQTLLNDQKIVLNKNKQIYQLKKQNQTLIKQNNKIVNQLRKAKDYSKNNLQPQLKQQQQKHQFQSEDEQIQETVLQEDIQMQDDMLQKKQQYQINNIKSIYELRQIQNSINQKQQQLNTMNINQIQLQYKLIEDMKQDYHQKIHALEKQKEHLINNANNPQSLGLSSRNNSQKIQTLQNQLKQYRKKVKHQKDIEKVLSSQNNKIKDLSQQIKTFKNQKKQLSKQIKEDKQSFLKFKKDKVKELMKAKKQNFKKQAHIKKVTFKNKANERVIVKKNEQLKKVKKINETLKRFLKQSNHEKKSKNQHIQQQNASQEQQFSLLIKNSIKEMINQIDSLLQIQKYEDKIQQINNQLKSLISQQSKYKLKLQRLKLSKQETVTSENNLLQQQLIMKIKYFQQKKSDLQEAQQFYKNKFSNIFSNQNKFDVQSIIYNNQYNNIASLRKIISCLFQYTYNILYQQQKLIKAYSNCVSQNQTLKIQIQTLKSNISFINSQFKQKIQTLRQQMILLIYNHNIQDQQYNKIDLISKNIKNQEKQKKNYDKKIFDLTKTNRQLSADVQMWRRKCGVIQQKYQNMRNIFQKDKFIGLKKDQQFPIKQKKLNHSMSSKNTIMTEQTNNIFQNNFPLKIKKGFSYEEQIQINEKSLNSLQKTQFNTNKWQCLGKIDAHNSPVLSLATYQNVLISSSTKSVKIWDLENSKMVTEISVPFFSSFVKCVSINKDKKIMATICDKIISIWDLQTLNIECQLKAHKDQIRTLHLMNNYMLSGGKGTNNGGSLLVWDYRKLNTYSLVQQKQKNQDIFTITSKNNKIYYGTRNHQVRRMNIETMQILSPLQPPHMDTVTGLAIIKNCLVSGSKDKNLKLWGLSNHQNSVLNEFDQVSDPISGSGHNIINNFSTSNSLKYTVHAFNDYINTIVKDLSLPIFYSGARNGEIKIGSIQKDKIKIIGGIIAHTNSVNCICPLEQNQDFKFITTGSSDKTIKIWKPTQQTLFSIKNQEQQ